MSALDILRDVLARIVCVREGLADGDVDHAAQVTEDLEHDLAGAIVRLEVAA